MWLAYQSGQLISEQTFSMIHHATGHEQSVVHSPAAISS
jgi:hypothetical protein